jgi:hypothetical protein
MNMSLINKSMLVGAIALTVCGTSLFTGRKLQAGSTTRF